MKNIKFIVPLIMVGFISVFTSSCSKSDDVVAVTTDTVAQKINIRSAQFDPSPVTILSGIKITWMNADSVAHSVVSDDGISFNSGNINAGSSYSFTSSATGTYNYHCGIHPAVKGIIYVVNR